MDNLTDEEQEILTATENPGKYLKPGRRDIRTLLYTISSLRTENIELMCLHSDARVSWDRLQEERGLLLKEVEALRSAMFDREKWKKEDVIIECWISKTKSDEADMLAKQRKSK